MANHQDPDLAKLEDWFTYHKPEGDQVDRLLVVRSAGMELARAIVLACPACADRSAALRKVREAVMTANASIVLGGK